MVHEGRARLFGLGLFGGSNGYWEAATLQVLRTELPTSTSRHVRKPIVQHDATNQGASALPMAVVNSKRATPSLCHDQAWKAQQHQSPAACVPPSPGGAGL